MKRPNRDELDPLSLQDYIAYLQDQKKELLNEVADVMDLREAVDNLISRLPDSTIDHFYDDNQDTIELQKAVKVVTQLLIKK